MGNSKSKAASVSSSRKVETNEVNEVDEAVKQMMTSPDEEDSSLVTEVQCKVAVKSLPKPGRYFVVAYERVGSEAWQAVGNTETSGMTDSPQFVKHIITRYSFESPQRMRLDLYMSVTPDDMKAVIPGQLVEIPSNAELLDSVECTIAEAVVGQDGYLQRPICKTASLSVFVDERRGTQTMVHFGVRLEDLDVSHLKARRLRKIRCSINRFSSEEIAADDVRTLVARTNTIDCVADKSGRIKEKTWESMRVSETSMCRGDVNVPVSLRLTEAGPKGEELLGSCEFTYKELEHAARSAQDLNLSLKGISGKLTLRSIQVERKDTFMDYVAGGLSINLFIAIDFTKSNREPGQTGSLHSFADPGNPNDYVRVIRSVVDILQYYDNDKLISVYGFGARLPPSYNHTSHCFACTGDFFNPEVVGVEEIIRVYREALDSVVLHGPTNFHELVRLVADFSEPYADPRVGSQKYSVLLILTDGVITDMKQTINEVVRAAEFPVSIVVVGIGEEDFGLMKILDGDDQRLYSTDERRFASRDIVQFVKFNDFKNKPMHQLATETLAEIPREVVKYFKARDIGPGSRSSSDARSQSSSGKTEEEDTTPLSDIAKQLEVMKTEFLEQVTKVITEVDEFEVYKIITEEKIPSRDLTFFQEIVSKAPRGVNVFSLPKPTNIDSVDSRSRRSAAGASKTAQPPKSSAAGCITNAPVVDLAGAGDVDDTDLASAGKPLAASPDLPSPAVKALLAKTFSLEHLTPPRSPTMQSAAENAEEPRPASPSVVHNLDLTKPTISLLRGDSRSRVVGEALPDATSA